MAGLAAQGLFFDYEDGGVHDDTFWTDLGISFNYAGGVTGLVWPDFHRRMCMPSTGRPPPCPVMFVLLGT